MMRIRGWLHCFAALAALGGELALADTVTVDLEYRTDTLEWKLYALVVDTGTGNAGDHGIAALRALIDNVNFGTGGNAVTIVSGIGAANPIAQSSPNERPAVVQTVGGTLDITYAQNILNAPSVVGGVGVGTRDLIMNGTFASAGLPPAFGNDDDGFTTDGNFLNAAAPGPFGPALSWNGVTLHVFDVTPGGGLGGDYNGDGDVNAADYTVWRNNLGGNASAFASGSRDPLNSGPVDADDYTFWRSRYGDSNTGSGGIASSVPVPEPCAVGLLASVLGTTTLVRRTRLTMRA